MNTASWTATDRINRNVAIGRDNIRMDMLTTVKNLGSGNVNKKQLNVYGEILVDLRKSNIVAFPKKQVVKEC